jgi:phage tail protein X
MATEYRTIQGDAWDSIAFRLWGDERFAADIIAANPGLADILVFPAGVTLSLPAVNLAARPLKTLPPWVSEAS